MFEYLARSHAYQSARTSFPEWMPFVSPVLFIHEEYFVRAPCVDKFVIQGCELFRKNVLVLRSSHPLVRLRYHHKRRKLLLLTTRQAYWCDVKEDDSIGEPEPTLLTHKRISTSEYETIIHPQVKFL